MGQLTSSSALATLIGMEAADGNEPSASVLEKNYECEDVSTEHQEPETVPVSSEPEDFKKVAGHLGG